MLVPFSTPASRLPALKLLALVSCLWQQAHATDAGHPARSAPDIGKKAASAPAPASTKGSGDPNILIIMLDDAGFAQADTFGGEIHTPTLSRIAQSGITYNAFHTTAISSATRAALLTGRNHHHVGNGTVTEASTDDPGYNGVIPDAAATLPQLLKTRGYTSAAFGKWHNTPPEEAGPNGPYKHWPTGYGFDHFYGFLGGESDQYHPHLYNDTKVADPAPDPKYHLTEDLAKQAVNWLDEQHAKHPGQPFFMYWAPGGVHAPHQVFKSWADKYKGRFDNGWDAYRARAFERQKALGWIPCDTVNTPRPAEMPAWDTLSPEEKAFQAREMEVYAGFLEHTDAQAGKVVDELEHLGLRKNTLIFYVFSDNGASSEGMQGTITDLAGLNGVQVSPQQSMKALQKYVGGLDALGGPKLEEHYSSAWAWAGESPFVGTKLVAGYFGGTRTPLAISWPEKIAPSKEIRTQFHHVNDIAPTIYDVLHLNPPAMFNGVKQMPMDGTSMAYTFDHAKEPTHKAQQYFEIMGSRAEYSNGWIASVLGPRKPWVADQVGLLSLAGKLSFVLHQPWIGDTFGWLKWKPENDQWALFNLKGDYSQAHDLSVQDPAKVAELKRKFDEDAAANFVNPIGASFMAFFHPKERVHGTDWHFAGDSTRTPEFAAPNIKSRDNIVSVDADFPARANGVLFSLGSVSAGLTLFVKDGMLTYEYNGFSIERTQIRVPQPLPAGRAVIDVDMRMDSSKRGGPATVALRVNGKEAARGNIPFTAPVAFTATGSLDVGQNTGSPVSLDYFDQGAFPFNGKIHDVHVQYK